MKYKIETVAEIFTGVNNNVINKQPTDSSELGELITNQSIAADGLLISEGMNEVWIDTQKINPRQFLRKSDVVVQTRGPHFRAGLVQQDDLKVPLIANINFVIIRPDTGIIKPEVLCFLLNSTCFSESVITTTRSNQLLINKKQLAKLEISVPSQSSQELIKSLFYATIELSRKTERLLIEQKKLSEAKFFELSHL